MCFIFDGWVCVGYFVNWELCFVNLELWFSYLEIVISDRIDPNTCVVGGIWILWHFSVLSLSLHRGRALILVSTQFLKFWSCQNFVMSECLPFPLDLVPRICCRPYSWYSKILIYFLIFSLNSYQNLLRTIY